jgi:hypothetical protein
MQKQNAVIHPNAHPTRAILSSPNANEKLNAITTGITKRPNQALQRTGVRLVAARPLSWVVSVSFMGVLGLPLSLIR